MCRIPLHYLLLLLMNSLFWSKLLRSYYLIFLRIDPLRDGSCSFSFRVRKSQSFAFSCFIFYWLFCFDIILIVIIGSLTVKHVRNTLERHANYATAQTFWEGPNHCIFTNEHEFWTSSVCCSCQLFWFHLKYI